MPAGTAQRRRLRRLAPEAAAAQLLPESDYEFGIGIDESPGTTYAYAFGYCILISTI